MPSAKEGTLASARRKLRAPKKLHSKLKLASACKPKRGGATKKRRSKGDAEKKKKRRVKGGADKKKRRVKKDGAEKKKKRRVKKRTA